MKKFLSFIMIVSLLINVLAMTSYAGDYSDALYLEYDGNVYKYNSKLVTVVINSKEIKTDDMSSVVIDGRTLVPAREIFESENFGATVDWNGAKKEVYITYADKFIVLEIDSNIAHVNGVEYELDVPAKLIRDVNKSYSKTMIPLRFVSEVLDFKVEWDSNSYTATLTGDTIVATTDPTDQATTEVVKPAEPEQNGDTAYGEGEKLEGLSDASASKELPTPLKDHPIQWSVTAEELKEIDASYVDTEITNEEHSETFINDVDYDDKSVFKKFIIGSSSAMSSINYFVWDNKFIIEVSNSLCDLPAEVTYENNPILTSVRASQFSTSPNVTRVVLDLIDGGSKFELSFNEDRTALTVMVMDNNIQDIYLGQNEVGDFLRVTGVASPDVKMFRLSKPDRIVIDFPNTKSVIGFNEAAAEGQYIQKIRTAQFDTTTTRVVVETDGQADYEVIKASNGETVIQFMEPGYKNIEYENVDSPTISLDQEEVDISIEGIVYENDYINRTYGIVLSKNYGELFGDGSLKVNDGIIDTINVTVTDAGQTRIDIKSTTVYEYRVEEVGDKIQIKAYKPKELYDKIIVIDPGHGGKDPGAMANELVEKTLNLKTTLFLKKLLDDDGTVKVYYTRTEDVYPTLQERCDLANEIDADFFVSIHNNAFNPTESGTETLYFPWNDPNALSSPDLAKIFHENIIDLTGNHDRGIKSRENLYVLKHTTMPAVLVEGAFLTNTGDAAKLKEDRYLQTIAQALYVSIIDTFKTFPTKR